MARVLIVDDESNIRMMLQLGLAASGFAVETASDGLEGLEKFGDGKGFDLCLLDQRMPGISGLETLREMRRRDPGANIIMITAFGTIDLAEAALRVGASDFLRKPFTLDVLRGAVTASLQEGARPAWQLNASNIIYDAFDVEQAGSGRPSFDFAAINGFRITGELESVSSAASVLLPQESVHHSFTVLDPQGEKHTCQVALPSYVIEQVRAHADRERFDDAFWKHLCEEALANYLWQNAELPDGSTLRVDDLTAGMRRWIDAVLTA